ncbi:MAG TPA: RDD family protein [Mycobacterium sp.]
MSQQPPAPPPPGSGYPPPPPAGAQAAAGQPMGALPPEAYTSWIQRVVATLVDAIPVVVIGGIGEGIAVATGNNSCVASTEGYGGACTSSFSAFGMLASFLAGLLVLAYSIWNWGYRQGTTGSTIGKSALKFKVISEATGQPIGFGMSIVRQFAHIVDGAICYIGYLFPLWDAKRQTLGDKIMSTVCVPIAS